MANKRIYDTPAVRVVMLAGLEAVLVASPRGSLPSVEEVENEYTY
jgi:hypothetical protein